ncbi:NUDIX hydrolase [Candidatus Curtissbacteria bacterium]|nr:NUDIX hydrolase [Candidatus Curtissbacteria bacterium]
MNIAYSVPISVKGIVFEDDKVWLRKNERGEWELPGGKLDRGEQPEKAVVRELKEELGFEVEVADIVQANLYQIEKSQDESKGVLVISYLCRLINRTDRFEIESEAGKAKFEKFSVEEVEGLNMPLFYKEAITKAFRLLSKSKN